MVGDRLRRPFIVPHLLLGLVVLGGCVPTTRGASMSPTSTIGGPESESVTAGEILMRVAAAYGACRSYSDSGVVTTVFIIAGDRLTDEKPFKTAFVRPDRFRFQFRNKSVAGDAEDVYIVWRKGSEVLTWWDVRPGVQKEPSLNMALGGATGVSGGSAHAIAALLLPGEVTGRCLTSLTDAIRVEDAELGGVQCFRIQGTHAFWPTTVWVEKRTFLVRRIDTKHDFGTFRAETITTYDPVLNGEVTDAMLAFEPPGQQ